MTSKRILAYCTLAALVGLGMIGLKAAWAQDSEPAAATTGVPTRTIVVPDGDAIRKSVEKQLAKAGIPFGNSMEAKIRRAAEKLRDAKDDQTKTEAREKLAELLGQYFDQDTARRQQELAKLQERLAKLQAQLQRRREMRQNIIDLQIQVALNEADGLGFMSRPAGLPFGGHFDFTDGNHVMRVSNGNASITVPTPHPHPTPGADADADADAPAAD